VTCATLCFVTNVSPFETMVLEALIAAGVHVSGEISAGEFDAGSLARIEVDATTALETRRQAAAALQASGCSVLLSNDGDLLEDAFDEAGKRSLARQLEQAAAHDAGADLGQMREFNEERCWGTGMRDLRLVRQGDHVVPFPWAVQDGGDFEILEPGDPDFLPGLSEDDRRLVMPASSWDSVLHGEPCYLVVASSPEPWHLPLAALVRTARSRADLGHRGGLLAGDAQSRPEPPGRPKTRNRTPQLRLRPAVSETTQTP
jgi:hypothetical protein